ncbi:unnamed protein product [Notodromas monacha]|uniref:Exocyst complex component 8 n=1 Tax=Notodromas monacha TaxID=399045 RepID=A0A7R9BLX8_9CRUS|nr:unnamed protein product [Notodromas monacha]CAG0917923.1 unnamed protein product [Notodromas monacha]
MDFEKELSRREFHPSKFVDGLTRVTASGRDFDEFEKQMMKIEQASSEKLKKAVYHFYPMFIRTSKEILAMESEVTRAVHAMEEQKAFLSSLLELSISGQKPPGSSKEADLPIFGDRSRQPRSASVDRSTPNRNDPVLEDDSKRKAGLKKLEAVEGATHVIESGNRSLLHDGRVREIHPDSGGELEDVHLFLLTDCLLVATALVQPRGPIRFRIQTSYPIDTVAFVNVRELGGVKLAFKVLTPTSSRTFQCLDIDTKKQWLESFDNLRKQLVWEKSQKQMQSGGQDGDGMNPQAPSPPDSPAPLPRERVGTILRKKEQGEKNRNRSLSPVSPTLESLSESAGFPESFGIPSQTSGLHNLPEWLRRAPRDLEVALALRNLTEAAELAQKAEEYFDTKPASGSAEIEHLRKIETHKAAVIELLASDLVVRPEKPLQKAPGAMRGTVQTLSMLGLSSTAAQLYLAHRSAILRQERREHRLGEEIFSYLQGTAQSFFQSALQTAEDFQTTFAAYPCCFSILVDWVQQETLQVLKSFETVCVVCPSISSLSDCIMAVRKYSKLLWDVGIDVTLTVERALRAQLNSLINSSRDTLLESIRGRWRIPEREAASGKPLDSAPQWQPTNLHNELNAKKWIDTMRSLGIVEPEIYVYVFQSRRLKWIDTMRSLGIVEPEIYVYDKVFVSLSSATIDFAQAFLLFVTDVAKVSCTELVTSGGSAIGTVFAEQITAYRKALDRAGNNPAILETIEKNVDFLYEEVLSAAKKKYEEIVGSPCSVLVELTGDGSFGDQDVEPGARGDDGFSSKKAYADDDYVFHFQGLFGMSETICPAKRLKCHVDVTEDDLREKCDPVTPGNPECLSEPATFSDLKNNVVSKEQDESSGEDKSSDGIIVEKDSIESKASEMSKRQRKKLAKKQAYLESLPERRKQEREKRKQRRKLPIEQRPEKVLVRSMRESSCKIRVALDFAYDDIMSEVEINQAFKQAMRCYSSNRRAKNPLQLYFTHLNGNSRQRCEKQSGFEAWDLHVELNPLHEIFPPNDVVYLTSESENVLESLNETKVYAIGAFVDHNHRKGESLQRAEKYGYCHARLPINEHVDMKTRQVLSHFHVFCILLDRTEGKSWEDSLCDNIPMRKGVKIKNKKERIGSLISARRSYSLLDSLTNVKNDDQWVDAKAIVEKKIHGKVDSRRWLEMRNVLDQYLALKNDMNSLEELIGEDSDAELRKLAEEDRNNLKLRGEELTRQALEILTFCKTADTDEILLEVSAGVGGQEAMLFAGEIFEMYQTFAESRGWSVEINAKDNSDIGGLRSGIAEIRGPGAYNVFKYEGGIHRVQRVPATEKSGRVHTSTVSVAILPVFADQVEVSIDPKDLKVETMRSSGAGGQHVNRTDSKVRLTHLPTGIAVECQEQRSQHQNKAKALRVLSAKLNQLQIDSKASHVSSTRKIQVGTKARSEKIRTYNFHQDRITDHRIGFSAFGVSSFLSRGTGLEEIICQLKKEELAETVAEIRDGETKCAAIVTMAAILCFLNSIGGDFVFDDTEAIVNNADVRPDSPIANVFINDFWGHRLTSNISHKSYRPLTVLTFSFLSRGTGLEEIICQLKKEELAETVAEIRDGETKCAAIVTMAAILCFLNSIGGDFVFDDTEAIVNNADVRPDSPIANVFINDFWGHRLTSNISHKSYRPLTVLTFRLNEWLVGGQKPAAFHVTNVSLHALVSFLIHQIVILSSFWTSWAGGSTIGTREWWAFAAGVMFFSTVSMLCKEYGITVLLLCFALDLVGLTLNGGRSHVKMDAVKERLTVLSFLCVFLLYLRWTIMGSSPPIFQPEDNPAAFADSLITRFLSRNYLFALNAWIMILPVWLCFDWSMGCVPLVSDYRDPRVLAVFVFWVFLLGIVGRGMVGAFPRVFQVEGSKKDREAQRDDARLILVGLVWLFIPFLPAANIFFTVGFVIAERVLYLPSLGYCIILTVGLRRLALLVEKSRVMQFFVRSLAVSLLVIFAARCARRNGDWSNEKTLFTSGLSVCPNNAKVHYNVAKHAADSGNAELAIEHYRKALGLNPVYDQAMNNLANLLKARGQLEDALGLLENATAVRPDFAAAWMNLGIVLADLKQYDRARFAYERALELRPRYPDCYYNFGNLFVGLDKRDEALQAWSRAIELKPTHALAWINIVILLDARGDVEAAKSVARAGLEQLPDNAGLHFNLANCLGKVGEFEESEKHFLRAVELEPRTAAFYSNLGVLYHRWKKFREAEQSYLKALALEPEFRSAKDNLAMLKERA